MTTRALINVSSMSEEIDISHLISLVEQNPVIWDKSLASYKCKLTRDYAWKNVCQGLLEGYEEMDDDVKAELYKEITKKWRSIKDNFIKYVKKMNESDPLTVRRATRYHHYDHLLFLKRFVTTGAGGGGEGVDGGAAHPPSAHPFNVCLVKEECEDEESRAESPPPPRRRRPRPRLRPRRLGPLEAEALRRLRQPDNRHLSFVRGILPTLDTFTDLQTLRFQRAVLDLVSQIKYGDKHYDET